MLATAEKFKDKPIVFIAVNSGNPRELVAAYAKATKVTWPIIVDPKRQFERSMGVRKISLNNIYQLYAIVYDGKVHGADWSDIEKSAEFALQRTKWSIDVEDLPESLSSARRALEFRDYSSAARDITRALESSEPREKAAAEQLNAVVMKELEKDASGAFELGKNALYVDADREYSDLLDRFKGYNIPEKHTKAAKWLAARPEVKREAQASKVLQAAKTMMASPKTSVRRLVPSRLQSIIKRFPDTDAAREAEEILKEGKR